MKPPFFVKSILIILFVITGLFITAQTNATFNIDMENVVEFNPLTDNIYISGNFAGWPIPGTNPGLKMSQTNDSSIYTLTIEVTGFDVIEYKYFRVINDTASWAYGEWDGSDNRNILVLNDTTLNDFWGDRPAEVRFNLDMSNADPFNPQTDDIYISGDLISYWTEPGISSVYKLQPVLGKDMTYTITLPLSLRDHEYKFYRVINNAPGWENGEWNEEDNRIVTVDTAKILDLEWGINTSEVFNSKMNTSYKLFPNPVQNTLFIRNLEKTDRIEIYNMVGQKVKTIENISTPEVNIDATVLKDGVYFISVYTSRGVMTSKFIKK